MVSELIREKLALLKPLPGCYLMKNREGKVIYVGKAKRLNVRVNSYFNRPHSGKTQKMVSEIHTFDTIITQTEKEALLLEINLIHLHNPPYNILLKDGKAYPYIQLKLGDHPYLQIARNVKDKKSKFFGPYSDGSAARSTLFLLNRLYPLRKCRTIPKKPCLYYHIGQCLGPCINEVSQDDYKKVISDITDFLKGSTKEVKKQLQDKMIEHSEKMEFEQAKEYRDLIAGIDHISSRQNVQIDNKVDRDVIAFHTKDEYIAISILVYRNGILCLKHNEVLSYYGDAEASFISYIMQYYENNIKPKEIIIPNLEDASILEEALEIRVITPSRGDKLSLLQMAAQNAVEGMEEKYLINKNTNDDVLSLLEDLGRRIGVPTPYTIELIDNSHIQGDEPVSAVVVFINGQPMKKMYRKYKVNSFEGRDDANSMYEVIYRRYYRKLVEQTPYSDLLIVDGGLIQINAAKKALDSLGINVPVVGLSKDNRHSTDALVLETGEKVLIKDNKDLFFLLTKMQDEVHRFVIGYHRDRRSKKMVASVLDDVPGIGQVRKEQLLKVYGSVNKIKEASIDELCQYLPKEVAITLKSKLDD